MAQQYQIGSGHDSRLSAQRNTPTPLTRPSLPNAPLLFAGLVSASAICPIAGLLAGGTVGFMAALSFSAIMLPLAARVTTRLTGLRLATTVDDVIALQSHTDRRPTPADEIPGETPQNHRPGEAPAYDGFWPALTAEEQRALREVSREQTFAPGEPLCQEGEIADHVIVIMSGWVKVFVERGGQERILAIRGPGDLVGERAAFEVRSRSASLVALDSVPALLVSTADFAAFIRIHPRVLSVIEGQVYARLTEEPGRSLNDETADAEPRIAAMLLELLPHELNEPDAPGKTVEPITLPINERVLADWAGTSPVVAREALAAWRDDHIVHTSATSITVLDAAKLSRIRDRAAHPALPNAAAPYWTGQNCTILLVDIAAFGDPVRTDTDRRAIRLEMYRMLRECFEQAGVPWAGCHREDRGDGALFVVPPSTPTSQVAGRLTRHLADTLRPYNHAASQALRLQLRAAIEVGPVMTDADGVTSDAIVRAARMLEAPNFKKEMKRARGHLGIIASDFVYQSVLKNDPTGYQRIRVQVKEADLHAWTRIRA